MAFDPISAVLGIGEKLIDKLLPDPTAKAAALQKLAEMQQAGELQVIANQVEIDKIEAANPRLFVSGWRPFIGWVCGAALAFQLVVGPLVVWGSTITGHPVALPIMQTELLTTLLVGMLGLGGMRTVEKLNNVASK
jgi:holin (3TMs family)